MRSQDRRSVALHRYRAVSNRIPIARLLWCLFATTSLVGTVVAQGKTQLERMPVGQFQQLCQESVDELASAAATQTDLDNLFELLMVSKVRGLKAETQRLQRGLLMRASSSLQARYLATTFENAKAYREVLTAEFSAQQGPIDADFCARHCGAVQLGIFRFGPGVLDDNAFLLQCALTSLIAKDARLQAACAHKLKNCKDADTKSIAEAAFGDKHSNLQRFVNLQPFHKNETSRAIQQVLYQTLSADQRQQIDVQQIVIENSLRNGQVELAIERLESLIPEAPAELKPQLYFWYALALNRVGRTTAAHDSLAGAVERFPNSQWAACSRQLVEVLAHQSQTLDELESLFERVTERFRSNGIDQIEVKFSFRNDNGRECSGLFGLDAARGQVAFGLELNGSLLAAYSANNNRSRYYLAPEEAIHEIGQAAFPSLNVSIDRNSVGKYNFNISGALVTETRSTGASWQRALASNHIATEHGRRELIQYSITTGRLWLPPVQSDGLTTWTQLEPKLNEPGFESSSIELDDEQRVIAYDSQDVRIHDIRMGPSGSFQFSEPAFPALETVHHDKYDAGLYGHLLASAAKLFAELSSEERVAEGESAEEIR